MWSTSNGPCSVPHLTHAYPSRCRIARISAALLCPRLVQAIEFIQESVRVFHGHALALFFEVASVECIVNVDPSYASIFAFDGLDFGSAWAFAIVVPFVFDKVVDGHDVDMVCAVEVGISDLVGGVFVVVCDRDEPRSVGVSVSLLGLLIYWWLPQGLHLRLSSFG